MLSIATSVIRHLALFDHYFLAGDSQSDLASYFGRHKHG